MQTKIVKSPLRYPGSKQKFCTHFSTILIKNKIFPEVFVEPFAGGASLSLHLLQNNLVKKIALIEKDSLVASFWETVFFDAEWLIKEIKNLDITITTWNYYKKYKPRTIRNKALKCLFLNRTNFSGILKAGPIGGQKQQSNYKINCRFNKNTIIQTILELSKYKDKIYFIKEGNYLDILNQEINNLPKNTFFYFDPPYVDKAKGLYNFYFKEDDHIRLRDFINELNFKWLLSYDYTPKIDDIYTSDFCNKGYFDITYTSTSKSYRPLKKEFLASNLNF